jgi:hypothetical protein
MLCAEHPNVCRLLLHCHQTYTCIICNEIGKICMTVHTLSHVATSFSCWRFQTVCGCACVSGEGGIQSEGQGLVTLSAWWLYSPHPASARLFVQY